MLILPVLDALECGNIAYTQPPELKICELGLSRSKIVLTLRHEHDYSDVVQRVVAMKNCLESCILTYYNYEAGIKIIRSFLPMHPDSAQEFIMSEAMLAEESAKEERVHIELEWVMRDLSVIELFYLRALAQTSRLKLQCDDEQESADLLLCCETFGNQNFRLVSLSTALNKPFKLVVSHLS